MHSSLTPFATSIVFCLVTHSVFAGGLDDQIERLRARAKSSSVQISVVPGDAPVPSVSSSTANLDGIVPAALPDSGTGSNDLRNAPGFQRTSNAVNSKEVRNVARASRSSGKEEPQPAATPESAVVPEKEQSAIWNLDSQAKFPAEPLAADGYEETGITVQRAVVAIGVKPSNPHDPVWRKKVTLTIPVLFKTGTLRLDEEKAARAKELIRRMEVMANKLQDLQAEKLALLKDINALVTAGTPSELLAADSPSLPSNTTATPQKRAEGFEAGKAIEIGVQ